MNRNKDYGRSTRTHTSATHLLLSISRSFLCVGDIHFVFVRVDSSYTTHPFACHLTLDFCLRVLEALPFDERCVVQVINGLRGFRIARVEPPHFCHVGLTWCVLHIPIRRKDGFGVSAQHPGWATGSCFLLTDVETLGKSLSLIIIQMADQLLPTRFSALGCGPAARLYRAPIIPLSPATPPGHLLSSSLARANCLTRSVVF